MPGKVIWFYKKYTLYGKMIFLCKENFNMRVFYYLSTCQTCKRIIKDLDLNDSIQRIDIKKTPINKDQLN